MKNLTKSQIKANFVLSAFLFLRVITSTQAAANILLPSKYMQAIELAGNSQYASAILALKQHIAEDPTFVPAYLRLAEFYRYEGKLSEGRNYFQEAVKRFPENPNFYVGLGFIAKWTNDWNQAFDNCKTAIKRGAVNAQVLELLVESAVNLNQTGQLRTIFKQLGRSKSQKPFADLGYVMWRYRENNVKTAIRTLKKYLDKNKDDWYGFYLLGKYSRQIKDFKSVLPPLETAIQIVGQSDPFGKLPVLHELGLYYQEIGRADSADYYLDKANTLAQKIGAKEEQVKIQQALFSLWIQEGLYQTVTKNSINAIRMAQEIEDHNALSHLYYSVASVYAIMGDSERAINFYSKTVEEANKTQQAELISKAYIGLGSEYMSTEVWEKALEYLNKGMNVAQEVGLSELKYQALLDIGDIYKSQMDIQRAKQSYEKVLRYAKKTKQIRLIENSLLNLIDLYLNFGSDLKSAKYYLTLAQALALQNFQIQFTANHRWMQGLISLNEGNYENAETLFSGAVQLGKESCSHVPILAGYAGLIKTYLAIERPDLAAAQADTALAYLSPIDGLYRHEYESKFFDLHRDLFLPAVNAFAKVGGASRIYDVCERIKIYEHRQNVRKLRFRVGPGVPASVKRRLDTFDNLVTNKQSELWRLWRGESSGNVDEVIQRKRELHQILSERDKFQSEIAKQYSQYSQLIKPQGEPLNQLTKLLKSLNANFIHYLVGENSTFILVVRPDSVFYKQIKVSRNYLSRLIEQMNPLFSSNKLNVDVLDESRWSEFNLEIAGELYQILIEPIFYSLSPQNTIIISADDVLSRLPFEILVKNLAELSDKFDYARAKYLVEDFAIAYVPYAQLLNGYQKQQRQPKKGFLVFDHSNWIPTQFKNYVILNKINNGSNGKSNSPHRNSSTKVSEDETRQIAPVIGKQESNLISNKDVTKERFLSEVSEYKFIYLAIPGILNDQQPLNSKLFFSTPNGSSDYLESYEFYNLELNAELVTLDIAGDEQSLLVNSQARSVLAQGFIFSGAKSLLMSLWNIHNHNKESVSDLLIDFYRHLKMGMNKSAALQQAKINYLKIGNRNPYYWAAYIIYGNPELTHSRPKYIGYLFKTVLIGLLLGGIFLLWRFQVAKKRGLKIKEAN
jgi:CHAT domain-containing protein/tetratricopeptide (TPR) repeat protein